MICLIIFIGSWGGFGKIPNTSRIDTIELYAPIGPNNNDFELWESKNSSLAKNEIMIFQLKDMKTIQDFIGNKWKEIFFTYNFSAIKYSILN